MTPDDQLLKNPRRVPMGLAVQNPTGITPPGTGETAVTVNRTTAARTDTVPETAIYVDDRGNPVQLVAGEPMPVGYTVRAEPAAPENRAITTVQTPDGGSAAAPENRTRKADQGKPTP